MTTQFGNPQNPCPGIKRSRRMLQVISKEAREGVERGTANPDSVEAGIVQLRDEVVQRLGMACGEVCGSQQRCMLDSFGDDDPIWKNRNPTPIEQRELDAKLQYIKLLRLSETAMGTFLG